MVELWELALLCLNRVCRVLLEVWDCFCYVLLGARLVSTRYATFESCIVCYGCCSMLMYKGDVFVGDEFIGSGV